MWKYQKVWDNQMLFDNPGITPPWAFTFSAQSSWCSSGQHTELQALQTAGLPAEGQVSSAACCNSQSPWEGVPGTSSRPSPLTAPLPSWRETAEGSPVHKYWKQRSKKGFTFISECQIFQILSEFRGFSYKQLPQIGSFTSLIWFCSQRTRKSCFPEHSRKQTRWLLSQLQVSLLPQWAQELFQLSALQSQRMFSY